METRARTQGGVACCGIAVLGAISDFLLMVPVGVRIARVSPFFVPLPLVFSLGFCGDRPRCTRALAEGGHGRGDLDLGLERARRVTQLRVDLN